MVLVQCIDAKKHITFGDLATDYCRQLTSCFAKAHIVADVIDRYDVKKTQDFLIVSSSWNMDTGIGPTWCERMLSIVTSSLLLAKTRARLKTISELI
jgi:hypothetical protein